MRKISAEELHKILQEHKKWRMGDGGKCADLSGADLRNAYLSGADLRNADLSGADLSGADLSGAYLRNADLSGADLSGAYLRNAYLSGADLSGAYLSNADLRNADLSGADLSGADLRNADLSGADLSGADLSDTSLYQVGGCGSAKRITTYDTLNDQVICGCWRDGKGNHLESFKERIEAIYGEKGKQPNAQYYAEYQAAIKFFEALKEVHNANR